MVSAPWASDNFVNPARSQNHTVTVRKFCSRWTSGSLVAVLVVGYGAREVPHPPQKESPTSLVNLQAGHLVFRPTPQLLQNLRSGSLVVLHCPHCIGYPMCDETNLQNGNDLHISPRQWSEFFSFAIKHILPACVYSQSLFP